MEWRNSRYFETAELMDEAFLSLLEEKDLEFITVKDVCSRAGVSRSTFYLHYESFADLMEESTRLMLGRFRGASTGRRRAMCSPVWNPRRWAS